MNDKFLGMPAETNWRAASGATAIDFELQLHWDARLRMVAVARLLVRDILIRDKSVTNAVFPYRPEGAALGAVVRPVDMLLRPRRFDDDLSYLESEIKRAVIAIWTELFGPVREEAVVFPKKWAPVRGRTP